MDGACPKRARALELGCCVAAGERPGSSAFGGILCGHVGAAALRAVRGGGRDRRDYVPAEVLAGSVRHCSIELGSMGEWKEALQH